MPLVVKKIDIPENIVYLNTFFDSVATRISYLNRLKNKRSLSDEEFLSILDSCYTYDLKDLDNDIITNSRLIFKSKPATFAILDTNMLLGIYDLTKRFIRYYAFARPSFEPKRISTLEELESSILKHEIIIDRGVYHEHDKSNLSAELKQAPEIDQETSKRAESLSISNLSLTDLGIYKDWFLPILKDVFTKERVAEDILELIAYEKRVMARRGKTLEEEKHAAERTIARKEKALNELKEYDVALNRLLEKKD